MERVSVIIKDDLNVDGFSMHDVLKRLDKSVFNHFLTNVDVIYVGDFDFLKERDVQAMYENSCIFVTNHQDSIDDMCDDIVHEIAHSLEDRYKDIIYQDGKIEKKFINKRKHLYTILTSEGYEVELADFLQPVYKRDFDEKLYREIGYETLNMLSASIFYSPYAATSLREYFANGFEALYHYRDYNFIKKACPELFDKLMELADLGDQL